MKKNIKSLISLIVLSYVSHASAVSVCAPCVCRRSFCQEHLTPKQECAAGCGLAMLSTAVVGVGVWQIPSIHGGVLLVLGTVTEGLSAGMMCEGCWRACEEPVTTAGQPVDTTAPVQYGQSSAQALQAPAPMVMGRGQVAASASGRATEAQLVGSDSEMGIVVNISTPDGRERDPLSRNALLGEIARGRIRVYKQNRDRTLTELSTEEVRNIDILALPRSREEIQRMSELSPAAGGERVVVGTPVITVDGAIATSLPHISG